VFTARYELNQYAACQSSLNSSYFLILLFVNDIRFLFHDVMPTIKLKSVVKNGKQRHCKNRVWKLSIRMLLLFELSSEKQYNSAVPMIIHVIA